MSITKSQAQTTFKNLTTESSSLTPSTEVILFEVDLTTLLDDAGINTTDSERFYRFHSNVKLFGTSIWFNNFEYTASPIEAEGFDISSKGTAPVPKLRMSVSEVDAPLLGLFKINIKRLDDLSGAKVTRRRTFAKYIDARNFPGNTAPDGFAPDPNLQFIPDVFYIDRKSNESKSVIEFELASLLDFEGVKLPNRVVFAKRCVATYRGEGCNFEYAARRTSIHGSAALPMLAPPTANEKDEPIAGIIGSNARMTSPELYDPNKMTAGGYFNGSAVYITKNNINYYFVCKVSNPPAGPPNLNYWEPDSCGKLIKSCRLRWGSNGTAQMGRSGLVLGQLPFVGFPGADTVR